MKPIDEIWKSIPFPPFEKYYQISNWGRLRSTSRWITRSNNRCREPYSHWKEGKLISIRTNGIEKHLFGGLCCIIEGDRKYKSAYIHLAVAMAFKKPSKNKDATKAMHRDGNYNNNWPSNLKWVSQSYLSKRNMKNATEERRNWIGNHQKKEAYKDPGIFVQAAKLLDAGEPMNKIGPKLGKNASWTYAHLERIKAHSWRWSTRKNLKSN
jgi:hypothetical protein